PINVPRYTLSDYLPDSNHLPSDISSPPSLAASNNHTRLVDDQQVSASDPTIGSLKRGKKPAEALKSRAESSLQTVSARKILEALACIGSFGGWRSIQAFTLEFTNLEGHDRICAVDSQNHVVTEVCCRICLRLVHD